MEPGHSIAMVYGADGLRAGLAIVVDERLITCAHVVNSAIGRAKSTFKAPDGRVTLLFPFAEHARIDAEISLWGPNTTWTAADDFAVLTPSSPMPDRIVPASLGTISADLAVRVCGPSGDHGTAFDFVTGRITGERLPGIWQLHQRPGPLRVHPGYSGGPVVRADTNEVIGLARAARDARTSAGSDVEVIGLNGPLAAINVQFGTERQQLPTASEFDRSVRPELVERDAGTPRSRNVPTHALLRQRVKEEAGFCCAVPTCRSAVVEIAHIDHGAQSDNPFRFENLIALCPNCHRRYDGGDIPRQSMLQYKANLGLHTPTHVAISRHLQLDAVHRFVECLKDWEAAIGSTEMSNVVDVTPTERAELHRLCNQRWKRARSALVSLKAVCSTDAADEAETVYALDLSWADDVVDGLWPSVHPAADRHDGTDRADALERLLVQVARDTGSDIRELAFNDDGDTLGGSGRRY